MTAHDDGGAAMAEHQRDGHNVGYARALAEKLRYPTFDECSDPDCVAARAVLTELRRRESAAPEEKE